MMNTLEILLQHPELAKQIKFEITGSDLLMFAEAIHKRATEEATPIANERYQTANQHAESLNVSLVTLWSWDKKGITHPLHIGGRKLYRFSDIEKLSR